MRKVGEILQQQRLDKGLSLQEVETETKIQKKFITAIEENDFTRIPGSTVAKGFISNYAQMLGLSPQNVLAVFRRDFTENKKGQILPRGMVEPFVPNKVYWTPKLTMISIVILLITIPAFILIRQFVLLSAAPKLELISPVDGQSFSERVIVSGTTIPESAVKIDGVLIEIDDQGKFNQEVVLPRGENILTVESSSPKGKVNTVRVRVRIE